MRNPGLSLNCCFCEEFDRGNMPSEEHCNRILEETLYAVALPSLGALAEGHILVVPKEHWFSLASIPLNTLKELNCVRNRMLNRLCVEYGPVLQFEHGVVKGRGGGCGIGACVASEEAVVLAASAYKTSCHPIIDVFTRSCSTEYTISLH